MMELKSYITIGSVTLNFANNVKIERSWKTLTDTAIITLPRNIKVNGGGVKNAFKKGDKVNIQLGYDDTMNEEFSGYVTRVEPGVPIKIHCEDEMSVLKNKSVNFLADKVTARQLIEKLLSGIDIAYDVIDTGVIGSFLFRDVSIAAAFVKIKELTGLITYFQNGKLKFGFPYDLNKQQKTVKYYLNGKKANVPESNVEYRSKEDVKLKVKAIAYDDEGKEFSEEVGDDDGDSTTLHVGYHVAKTELKAKANAYLAQMKVDGFRGELTGFGYPYCDHGDIAEIEDELEDRSGRYFIDKVVVEFGTSGFRRQIELGKSA